jgi:hypothetical protein
LKAVMLLQNISCDHMVDRPVRLRKGALTH